jgi:hypothetical protein
MKLSLVLLSIILIGQCASFLSSEDQGVLQETPSKVFKIELKKHETTTFSAKDMFDFLSTSQSYLRNPREDNLELLDTSVSE